MLYWTVVQYSLAARATAASLSDARVFVGPVPESIGGQDTVGLILHPFEGRDDDGNEDQRSRRNCAGGLSCCPQRIVRCEKKSSIRSELARRPTDPPLNSTAIRAVRNLRAKRNQTERFSVGAALAASLFS